MNHLFILKQLLFLWCETGCKVLCADFGSCILSPPDFDANNIFKAFFGGPGGFSFEGNLCAAFKAVRNDDFLLSSVWNDVHNLRTHQLLTCLFCVTASGPGNFFFQFG